METVCARSVCVCVCVSHHMLLEHCQDAHRTVEALRQWCAWDVCPLESMCDAEAHKQTSTHANRQAGRSHTH